MPAEQRRDSGTGQLVGLTGSMTIHVRRLPILETFMQKGTRQKTLGGPGSSRARSFMVVGGLGAAIVLMACGGAAVFFFLQHRQSEPASEVTAAAEFRDLRTRFAGQAPLLAPEARQPLSAVRARPRMAPLHSFHTVIFDTRGSRRLVRITVPYWFGRMYARHGGSFRWLGELTFLDDTEFDPVPIDLPVEAIERHGPGLLVDFRHPGGGQFIAWVD